MSMRIEMTGRNEYLLKLWGEKIHKNIVMKAFEETAKRTGQRLTKPDFEKFGDIERMDIEPKYFFAPPIKLGARLGIKKTEKEIRKAGKFPKFKFITWDLKKLAYLRDNTTLNWTAEAEITGVCRKDG